MNWSSEWKSRVDGKARIDREKLYGDKLKIRFQRSRSVICQWAPLASNVKQERWACNESWTEFDSKNRLHSIIAEQKAFSLRFFSLVSMKEMKLLVANPFLSTFRFSGSLNQLTLLFSKITDVWFSLLLRLELCPLHREEEKKTPNKTKSTRRERNSSTENLVIIVIHSTARMEKQKIANS